MTEGVAFWRQPERPIRFLRHPAAAMMPTPSVRFAASSLKEGAFWVVLLLSCYHKYVKGDCCLAIPFDLWMNNLIFVSVPLRDLLKALP